MGKHIFTKLVHLKNKSYGIHKELDIKSLAGGTETENRFSGAQTREGPHSFPGLSPVQGSEHHPPQTR